MGKKKEKKMVRRKKRRNRFHFVNLRILSKASNSYTKNVISLFAVGKIRVTSESFVLVSLFPLDDHTMFQHNGCGGVGASNDVDESTHN